MKLEEALQQRSGGHCEICGSETGAQVYEVKPQDVRSEETCCLLCAKCTAQIEKKEELDGNYWKY